MFSNSFTWFVVNLAIGAIWLAAAVATREWWLALGTALFIGIGIVFDLPDSSSEEGSGDDKS